MKKFIKFLSLFAMNSLLISTTVSCTFSDNSSNTPNPPTPPPTPPKKTIDDYKNDIKFDNKKIKEVKKDLEHIDEITDKDLKEYVRNMDKGTIAQYNAAIQDDNYQILLLENNNNLSPDAKKEAKKYLNSELDYLKNEISFLNNKALHGDAKPQVEAAKKQQTLVNKELNDLKNNT